MSTRVAQIRNSALGARVIVVCALVLVASSMLKFWHPGPILTYLGSMGYEGADVYLIAVIELATALLLLFPRTRAFGLFMASAYLGGAVAAHVAIHRYTSNDPFVAFMAMHTHIGTLEPGVLLAALWFGSWLSQRRAQALSSTPAHATLRQAASQPSAYARMNDGARVETFLQYRPLLLSIAYRMLGSMADAEDLVQETFIRWEASSELDVHSPRAYLVTILSRLCIHQLESARVQREQYVGPWLPEPVSTGATADPLDASELQESLSMAFLLLLERLSPVERAAFLLHEVFGYGYDELVRVLSKSEATCRQIVHRARRHVTENRPRFDAAPEQHERLLREFVAAASSGDLQGLVSVLSDEVVPYSDGGGKANAALRPVHGAVNVARFVLGAIAKSVPKDVGVHIEPVNGQPGVVYRLPQGAAGCVISVVITGRRISDILVVTNPDKLVHVATRS